MQRINLGLVVFFYGALMAAAMGWAWLRGDSMVFVHPEWLGRISETDIIRGVALGLATAIAVVVLSRLSVAYFQWSRNLERDFGRLLGRITIVDILVIAFFSGIAEEAFFRGAMQPAIGWVATTLLFGLLHIGPSKQYIPWTISALALGGLLGWYFEQTGTLAAPIVAHVLINLINLMFIRKANSVDTRA